MLEFLLNSIAAMIGGSIGGAVMRRRWAGSAKRGSYYCGLRLVTGRQRGLSSEWRIGGWQVSPGRLELEGIVVDVKEVALETRRTAALQDTLAGNETVIFTARTAEAELEWSMLSTLESQALIAIKRR